MNRVPVSALAILVGGLLCGTPLFSQDGNSHQASNEKQVDTIAIVDFGVNDARYKSEAGRIPIMLRALLEEQEAAFVLDMEGVSDRLMGSSMVLNTYATDSSYWYSVGKIANAAVVIHGLVKPQNDTVVLVDLFVADLAQNHVYKTALKYNPAEENDSVLMVTLYRIIDDMVMFGRIPLVAEADVESEPGADSTSGIVSDAQSDDTMLLWLLEGVAIVAATVTIVALLGESTDPDSNNLPNPPQFP